MSASSVLGSVSSASLSLTCAGGGVTLAAAGLVFLELVTVVMKLTGLMDDGSTDVAPIGLCIGSSRICWD